MNGMKKQDISLIVVVVFVSAVFSLIISGLFISAPQNRAQQVEVVGRITTEFPEADKKIFNQDSINPTFLICIGSANNQCSTNQPAE